MQMKPGHSDTAVAACEITKWGTEVLLREDRRLDNYYICSFVSYLAPLD